MRAAEGGWRYSVGEVVVADAGGIDRGVLRLLALARVVVATAHWLGRRRGDDVLSLLLEVAVAAERSLRAPRRRRKSACGSVRGPAAACGGGIGCCGQCERCAGRRQARGRCYKSWSAAAALSHLVR